MKTIQTSLTTKMRRYKYHKVAKELNVLDKKKVIIAIRFTKVADFYP